KRTNSLLRRQNVSKIRSSHFLTSSKDSVDQRILTPLSDVGQSVEAQSHTPASAMILELRRIAPMRFIYQAKLSTRLGGHPIGRTKRITSYPGPAAFKVRRRLVSLLGTRHNPGTRTKVLLAILILSISFAVKSLHSVDLAKL